MHTEHFSLTANAFWVLKADYKSNTTEISDLVDDAEFDENFSQDLIQRSQQALLSPIARLDQELSWLPELSSNQTEEISSLLASNELNKLVGAVDFLPDLPKANVLAHLCGTNSIEEKVLQNLLQAWDDIREIDLLSFVNSERQIAGFPKVEMAQLENAVKAIGSKHARNAAMAVWKFNAPGKLMETLVEEELRRGSTSSILAQFVREYDNLSEPKLVQISDSIEGKIKQVSEPRCDLEGVVDEISDLLRQWDDVNQAVQVFEQHQGHEEGRSKRIYEKVRELCLELANDRSEFLQAKRLSEALLHTFPELESVAEVLRGDVETLESLDEQKRQFAVVEPLVAACETAKQKLRKLKLELQKTGFKQARGGLLHEIFVAFENAAKSPEARDAAFLIVRDLALFANNERDDPETAFRLIDGLLTYRSKRPSQEVFRKLNEERAVVHRSWKMAEMEKHSGNLGSMAKTVDEMLEYAKGNDRTELLQLKSRIDRKQAGKKAKWLIYGGIAAVIAFFVISEELNGRGARNSGVSSTTYKPPSNNQTSTTSNSFASSESQPPVGKGLSLNKPQVRYCVFQGERLDAMRVMVNTDNQIRAFNELIDDFNSRCSNYRYTSGVLSSIRREAQSKTSEFTNDAKRTVGSW